MVSFLLTTPLRRWYIIGAQIAPNDGPTVYCMYPALYTAPKGLEVILLGDLNVRLQELSNVQGEYIAAVVADCRLVDMISHFMSRRRYIEDIRWMWQMKREDQQLMGRGDYVLVTNR